MKLIHDIISPLHENALERERGGEIMLQCIFCSFILPIAVNVVAWLIRKWLEKKLEK